MSTEGTSREEHLLTSLEERGTSLEERVTSLEAEFARLAARVADRWRARARDAASHEERAEALEHAEWCEHAARQLEGNG